MIILAPLGWLYGRIMQVRNSLYDRGIFRSYYLGAKTISVGNITTGGTGKTPLVAYIAKILAEKGEKVCVLTRGYGRRNENERVLVSDGEKVLVDAETGGDEPVELAKKLLGKAVVIADADRVSGGRWAKEKFGVTVFVLDDAFQHRRAKRNLDIVCIDATDPFGGGRIPGDVVLPELPNILRGARAIPAGRLREPLSNLKRAEAIVMTRADLTYISAFISQELIEPAGRNVKIFSAALRVGDVRSIEQFDEWPGANFESQIAEGDRAFAFCGLGNPEAFALQLAEQQFTISGMASFGDHHRYDEADIVKIEEEARALDSTCLVTTAKDAVKLTGLKFTMPCFVLEVSLSISDPAAFRDLVLSA